jgi:hypothetical protein
VSSLYFSDHFLHFALISTTVNLLRHLLAAFADEDDAINLQLTIKPGEQKYQRSIELETVFRKSN